MNHTRRLDHQRAAGLMRGPDDQCPVMIPPWRCTYSVGHKGECASWDADGNVVLMGVERVTSNGS